MGTSRKRGRQEMENPEPPAERSMIDRIRNMWEFANLAQWIFIFGKSVKIDENLDIEDLEMECMKMNSTALSDIGLALLKFVSSHRGLTPEIFDEYTRRQYVAKAPHRNPFGIDEEPKKFLDFDIFTKIRVLQQLTQWTMINPDRIRERMEEQKDSDQTYWRVEPFGWDSIDRTYFVLDDNRLYRQIPAPPPRLPTPPPKKNSKKAKAALRASKRRRISEPAITDDEVVQEPIPEEKDTLQEEDDGLGGMKWECVAITLDDLNEFIASIEKSRDPNEKVLRSRLVEDLLPLLEKQEEARKRKAAQKERELLNLEKLATAKRSSRIAGKLEQQRQEDEAREAERKKLAELAMARKEQEKWTKLEKERESRMMTREQRLKEREARRILHEEELAHLSEDSKKLETGESRLSERHLKAEIEKKKQALEELAEEDDWVFDCICGAYGQVDDGTHSIACEKCNVWQHTKCVGISEAEANRDDFHFICKTCKRRAEEEEKAKHRPTIKLKVNRPRSSSSPTPAPPTQRLNSATLKDPKQVANGSPSAGYSSQKPASIHFASPSRPTYESPYTQTRTVPTKPQSPRLNESDADLRSASMQDERLSTHISAMKWSPQMNGYKSPGPSFQSGPRTSSEHAFSPPHPYSPTSLPPPPQPPSYSFVNGQSSPSVSGSFVSPAASQQSAYNGAQPYYRPSPLAAPVTPYSGYQFTPSQPVNKIQNGQPHSETHRTPSAQPEQPYSGENYLTKGQIHRQDSVTFASPLATNTVIHQSATKDENPVLSDASHGQSMNTRTSALTTSSELLHSTPGEPPQGGKPSQTSALPSPMTGISPTKYSSPRTTTASGATTVGSITPSVLPPVASLAPIPQKPNLSPPVKMAGPEKNREMPQTAAP